MRERRVDMLHRLHAGGVRMATGIDAGIGPWVAGNFHRGVSQLEDASFSPVPGVASQGGARAGQPSVPIYAISGRASYPVPSRLSPNLVAPRMLRWKDLAVPTAIGHIETAGWKNVFGRCTQLWPDLISRTQR